MLEKHTVSLKNMRFFAYHGYYAQEQKVGSWFSVTVSINTNFTQAAKNDDLSGTINYEEVYSICKQAMQQPQKLIENVAHHIINQILAAYKNISHIKVGIDKEQAIIDGKSINAFVCIEKNMHN